MEVGLKAYGLLLKKKRRATSALLFQFFPKIFGGFTETMYICT